MDVTFTNVLEGARQYFQGLPAATSASAVPTYSSVSEASLHNHPHHHRTHHQHQHHYNEPQSNKENGGGDVAPNGSGGYWPPVPQRPPNHQQSSNYSGNYQQQPQQQQQHSQEQQMYSYSSRPHSRENNQYNNNQQQTCYSSQRQDLTTLQPPPPPPPSSSSSATNQNYHYHSSGYVYGASSSAPSPTSRSYNYNAKISNTATTTPTTVSSQNNNNQDNNLYYKHLYSPHSSTAAATSSSAPPPLQSSSTLSAQYRSTHNLPPIASLSLTSYHSNKNIKPSSGRSTMATTTTTTATNSKVNNHRYLTQEQYRSNNYVQQQQQPYNNATPTTSQNYTQVIMTATSANTSQTYHQSSSVNHHHLQQQQSYYQQQQQPGKQSSSSTVNGGRLPAAQQPSTPSVLPQSIHLNKQKKESPLDLSVKTVRTPADSTLDDADHDNRTKYYRTDRPHHNNYPTCDVYGNSFNRNTSRASNLAASTTTSAPKVEFHPNFNVSINAQQNYHQRRTNTSMNNNNNNTSRVNNTTTTTSSDANNKVRSMGCYPTVSVPTAAHVNSYIQSTIPPKRQQQQQQRETLPRIDFPSPGHGHKTAALYPVATRDADNKRPADTPPPSMIPNKMCKVDTWRQTIDQQIEQRLSSHLQQQEAKIKAAQQAAVKQQQQQHNGNYSQETTNNYNNSSYQQYPNTHHLNQRYSYPNHSHNQTYVPSAGAHQYPGGYGGYPNNLQHSTTHHQPNYMSTSSQQQQPRPNFSSKTNSNNNNHSGADKRVITLLRNSLESKGVANKEAAAAHQKKIEQTANYKHQHVQHPTTDVTAPLQPKPSFINRHNVSPFTPTNLPENHNMTMYKLHLPKAIDSVNFDADSAAKMVDGQVSNINPNGDLDGLAAFLAARIRTKAELKQVGPSSNNNSQQPQHHVKQETDPSPPKLSKEQQLLQQKHAFPPRRRLFSRNEDDAPYSTNSVPPRDKSGMRSSSETSVFDFPDTDSDSEMPVLERQSLEDMRRDRKAAAELKPPPSPGDDMFKQCCDSFVEQLKNGCGKKRGRRKKMVEADVIAKLETVVTKDKPLTDEVVTIKKEIEEETLTATTNIKQEVEDEPSMQEQEHNEEEEEGDDDQDDDGNESDVPLNKLKDNSSKQKLDTQILKEIPSLVLPRPAKKPSFGDGSDFCPGWEEEVYKYKKSLRMPPSLIQVTRPPQYHRLSTSLPDLDPCPNSPTPSLPTADNINDYLNMKNQKMKIKLETTAIDSDDTESNNSFNLFGLSSNKHHYDSEGGSSINSLPNMVKENNSILDKLLEKCGGRKKRKSKRKDELYPKIVPKPDKPVELLATPTKEEQAKTDAISLGFRTKTINNFKNVFNKNVKELRSRKSNNHRHHRISIKEVFGEDRPASAPPVTCLNNIKVKEELTDDGEDNVSLSSLAKLQQKHHDDTKQALKNKLLNRNRKDGGNLLKTLVDKKIKSELLVGEVDKFQGQQQSVVVGGEDEEIDCKSETPSIDGDEGVGGGGAASGKHNKQRNKLTKIRRKLSSGFDYIRKKKKSVKKSDNNNQDNNSEANLKVKQRKNLVSSKSNPGSVQDIQKEIKGWVLNKGIGETILHRSARLGYTDITAYCLENMECLPSPKDNAGYTPLHEASTKGHLGIAKMLLLYGANVSESARGGIRPLHEAVENGYVEIVRLLLSYGADPLLATYAGITPLQLASDEATINLLQNHINDVQGRPSSPWIFPGPASCFDLIESGFNLLDDEPIDVIESEEDDIDFEMSDHLLPNLYTLRSESNVDRWVLLQDLSNLLKIKSRDALLRQICGNCSAYKSVLRELKMSDFLEQAHCCQFLNIGEKINTRASKIALVKYTDKVKELLKVEKVSISIR